MIKVVFFASYNLIAQGKEYYINTNNFILADEAATNKAERTGVDLKQYPHKALSLVDVLEV